MRVFPEHLQRFTVFRVITRGRLSDFVKEIKQSESDFVKDYSSQNFHIRTNTHTQPSC